MLGDRDDIAAVAEDAIGLLSLVAACSLEDVDSVLGRRKGKDSGGLPTDEELAFTLFASEARALQILTRDMAFAQSMDHALRTDATLLAECCRAEEMARRDREIAIAIAEGRTPPKLPLFEAVGEISTEPVSGNTHVATQSSVPQP